MRTMEEELATQGFDLNVTKRHPQTGEVISQNPYILRVIASPDGGKSQLFERPCGSGNLWNKRGQPIGRWIKDEKHKNGYFAEGAEHIVFVPPETADQMLARELVANKTRVSELEKELAQIKAEGKSKVAPVAKKEQGS